MAQALVGVFDSGIGGLSVAREIKQLLPDVAICYVADSEFAPYGDKSPEQVVQRCELICEFLLAQGVDAIAIACNTATVHHIEHLRQRFNVPFIGVEPGIKPAVAASINKRIGVLATRQTAASRNLLEHVRKYEAEADIFIQPCPGLAESVEKLDLAPVALLQQYLAPLVEKGIDQLVLGCTHYRFLEDAIRSITQVEIVDTASAVAKQVQRILLVLDKPTESNFEDRTQDRFYTTGGLSEFSHQLSALWPDTQYQSLSCRLTPYSVPSIKPNLSEKLAS